MQGFAWVDQKAVLEAAVAYFQDNGIVPCAAAVGALGGVQMGESVGDAADGSAFLPAGGRQRP